MFKLFVLLGGYLVLPYNSIKPNFGFLQWLQPELWRLELRPSKLLNFRNNAKSIVLQIAYQTNKSYKSVLGTSRLNWMGPIHKVKRV